MKRHYVNNFRYDNSFRCSHCRRFVVVNGLIGTSNRNHCSHCLWSKHVDINKGDRKSSCNGGMKPVGLTFKHDGLGKQGEIMLIHACSVCQKISINRIARDDYESEILKVFNDSLCIHTTPKKCLEDSGIRLLDESDREEVLGQLFGRR